MELIWELKNLNYEPSVEVYKSLVKASRALSNINAVTRSLPNQKILLDIFLLQEARKSSEIENIVTTHDEVFSKSIENPHEWQRPSVKEVRNYVRAVTEGLVRLRENGIISRRLIVEIQEILLGNNAGFRRQAGTKLMNESTGEVVYIPPQHPDQIENLMADLIEFINNNEANSLDPLIKAMIIHHQFESIHPFYDGNGRTGRMLIVLYLLQQELIELPLLYLSQYINKTKGDYYRHLQEIRMSHNYDNYLIYMLNGVEQISIKTSTIIQHIRELMVGYKGIMRDSDVKNLYSHELLNNIFRYPYTRIEYVQRDLNVTRVTAKARLDNLVSLGLLRVEKQGKYLYYINQKLVNYIFAEE